MRRLLLILGAALVFAPSAAAWSWPADGDLLKRFVFDPNHPYAGGQHRGIDIAGADGSSVRAPASGTVSFAGTVPTSGKTVTIQTADGYSVTLVHLGSITVARGKSVAEGEAVGAIGSSGEPEWPEPYVHLGIRVTANPQGYVDPLGLLPARVSPTPELVATEPAAIPSETPREGPSGDAAAAAELASVPTGDAGSTNDSSTPSIVVESADVEPVAVPEPAASEATPVADDGAGEEAQSAGGEIPPTEIVVVAGSEEEPSAGEPESLTGQQSEASTGAAAESIDEAVTAEGPSVPEPTAESTDVLDAGGDPSADQPVGSDSAYTDTVGAAGEANGVTALGDTLDAEVETEAALSEGEQGELSAEPAPDAEPPDETVAVDGQGDPGLAAEAPDDLAAGEDGEPASGEQSESSAGEVAGTEPTDETVTADAGSDAEDISGDANASGEASELDSSMEAAEVADQPHASAADEPEQESSTELSDESDSGQDGDQSTREDPAPAAENEETGPDAQVGDQLGSEDERAGTHDEAGSNQPDPTDPVDRGEDPQPAEHAEPSEPPAPVTHAGQVMAAPPLARIDPPRPHGSVDAADLERAGSSPVEAIKTPPFPEAEQTRAGAESRRVRSAPRLTVSRGAIKHPPRPSRVGRPGAGDSRLRRSRVHAGGWSRARQLRRDGLVRSEGRSSPGRLRTTPTTRSRNGVRPPVHDSRRDPRPASGRLPRLGASDFTEAMPKPSVQGKEHRSGRGGIAWIWLAVAALLTLAIGGAGLAFARTRFRPAPSAPAAEAASEGEASPEEARIMSPLPRCPGREDRLAERSQRTNSRRRCLALCGRSASHRPYGGLRRPLRCLRALSPLAWERRADGLGHGRARNAGDGRGRPGRRVAA